VKSILSILSRRLRAGTLRLVMRLFSKLLLAIIARQSGTAGAARRTASSRRPVDDGLVIDGEFRRLRGDGR